MVLVRNVKGIGAIPVTGCATAIDLHAAGNGEYGYCTSALASPPAGVRRLASIAAWFSLRTRCYWDTVDG